MLDPTAFTPSLNRAVLAALPGLPAALHGVRAFDWLSSVGIAHRIRERIPDLDLDPVPDGLGADAIIAAGPYPRCLDHMVEAGDARAVRLADDLGVALAALVATLRLGPEDARAARPDWPAEHWERWAAVRRVGVGGGVVAGSLGARMVASAVERLPGFGGGDVDLRLVDAPGTLVLRGVGTALPDGPALLVDAGHTAVKYARARIADGRCGELEVVRTERPPRMLRAGPLAEHLADEAAGIAPERVRSAGFAVAAYTDAEGQPLAGQPGLYGSLGVVHLASYLAARLEDRLGYPIFVRTAGDGDAAAKALVGVADAAIVLGTAIGAGLNVP
jgi:hypothetical protein